MDVHFLGNNKFQQPSLWQKLSGHNMPVRLDCAQAIDTAAVMQQQSCCDAGSSGSDSGSLADDDSDEAFHTMFAFQCNHCND